MRRAAARSPYAPAQEDASQARRLHRRRPVRAGREGQRAAADPRRRPDPRTRRRRRTALALRQPRLHGARQELPRARRSRRATSRRGTGLVLRQQIPWPPHLVARGVRHVRLQRRAQDAAAAVVRARHQPGERQVGDRARQRSRPVPRRPRDRPELRRRGEARRASAPAPRVSKCARSRSDDRGPDMRVADDPHPVAAAGRAERDGSRWSPRCRSRSAEAGERKPATANAEAEPAARRARWRFDMRQDGKAMTADEFDAWMKERQVRVATGKSANAGQRARPSNR